jgi:plasmid segregation protein ParM
VKAAFPKHRIHEVKEPMFANVRGFQLAGQNYAQQDDRTGKEQVQGASGGLE